jgi:hypothetical protein
MWTVCPPASAKFTSHQGRKTTMTVRK